MTEVATINDETGNIVQPTPDESATLISLIHRAASDPNVDISKMERLFDMHEKMETRRAISAYNEAMAKAQAKMPAIVRNKENKQTNSKYADLWAIADEALPVIHEHGFGLSFAEAPPKKEGNYIGISCTATHAGGHEKEYHFDVPVDDAGLKGTKNKTVTHAYGSTMTYGRRYATCGVFNIIVKDADTDGNTPQGTITEEQASCLLELLSGENQDMPGFCAAYRIDKIGDLPANQYDGALKRIENRNKNLAEQTDD